MNLRAYFLIFSIGFILLGISSVVAEECIKIAGTSYCCSSTPDSVCPEDYEDASGVRVSCDSLPNGDIDCEAECEDGEDNDNDGCVDSGDNDCSDSNDNSEWGTQCSQGLTCQITDAYWANGDLSKPMEDLTASMGQYVFLVVKGNSYCSGEGVDFSIDKEGTLNDPSDPPSATFIQFGSEMRAVSYWKTVEGGAYTFSAETSDSTIVSANSLIVDSTTIVLDSITLSPPVVNLHTPNGIVQYTVLAKYTNGFIDDVTHTSVTTYSSSDSTIVSVVPQGDFLNGGLATAKGAVTQTAKITAKFPTSTPDEKSDTSTVILVGGDSQWVDLSPSSASLKLMETADLFSLFLYVNGNKQSPALDQSGTNVVFSVDKSNVAKVEDPFTGLIKGLGMGTTLVKGTYTTLYDEGFLTVIPTNDAPTLCGNGKIDLGEQCEINQICPDPGYPYCSNCVCISSEEVGETTIITSCIDGRKIVTKIFPDNTQVTTDEGSCTPLSTSVPFFGWIHVVITLSLLTGYYVWRRNKN